MDNKLDQMLIPVEHDRIWQVEKDYHNIVGRRLGDGGSSDQYFNIDYFLICMKESHSGKEKTFMQLVDDLSNRDLSYLEVPSIQTVINHKWKKFTKSFYLRQFLLLLLFTLSLIIDLWTFADKEQSAPSDSWITTQRVLSRLVCSMAIAYFFYFETKELLKEGFSYFKSKWNIFDICLNLTYGFYVLFSFFLEEVTIKYVQCLIILLTLLKVMFYLRIFDGISFLVQMVALVFYDLRYFLLLYAIFIYAFSVFLAVLLRDY